MPPVKKPYRIRDRHYFKAWRKFRDLSQERMAARLGISRENYGRIENGKIPYNQDFLELAAEALSCTKVDLLERDPLIEQRVDELRDLIRRVPEDDRIRLVKFAKSLIENKG